MRRDRFNGEALRRLRRGLGAKAVQQIRRQIDSAKKTGTLTQAELAHAIGMARNIVNRAEAHNQCSVRAAGLLAEVLQVPVDRLYTESPGQGMGELTPDERHVIQVMRTSPEAAEYVRINADAYAAAVRHAGRFSGEG